ncbi:hypothetical protein KUTeg_015881 [Tegillarca granosa]|uniref:Uncharacterized protein n=1 Tax=Tegillarca granosa TaxID=220873 RepID=A0ABQ9EN66_TEGGR|nr:hypothetical protein KUTeg_015881 [Tegillarca granosa]
MIDLKELGVIVCFYVLFFNQYQGLIQSGKKLQKPSADFWGDILIASQDLYFEIDYKPNASYIGIVLDLKCEVQMDSFYKLSSETCLGKSSFQIKKYSWQKKRKVEGCTQSTSNQVEEDTTNDAHNWSLDSSNNENVAIQVEELENQACESNSCELSPFVNLRENLKTTLKEPCFIAESEDDIKIFELYNQPGSALNVKQSITIDQDFKSNVWNGIPDHVYTYEDVNKLLSRILLFSVCTGNCDEELKKLIPVGAGICDGFTTEIRAYGEGDFCAFKGV